MTTKISQDELRKLMKEKRENLKTQKVDSPFAKYNSLGQLSCSICNIIIKSNNLWSTHIVGKTHKENLQKCKKSNIDSLKNSTNSFGVKRSSEQVDSPNAAKKTKTNEVFKVPQVPNAAKSSAATTLLAGYSSSSDEESDDDDDERETNVMPGISTTNASLPPNFFDNKLSNGVSTAASAPNQPVEPMDTKLSDTNKVEVLPEGFFDDPILDAKARNIEYRDPVEEEWERFKKSIAEESNVSKTIIEEDLEESLMERGINQIDEQIHHWERKINLESLADTVKSKVTIKSSDGNESETTDDDLDEDDLLDWRSKSIKKV